MIKPCPRQSENKVIYKKIVNTSDGQKSMLAILLVFSIFIFLIASFDRSSTYMIVMIRSLQLITHLPLMQVIFHSNVIGIMKINLELLMFDFLNAIIDWNEQKLIKFSK